MTERDDPKRWLETIAEGGLPQVLAGPAGKAISRLIGSGVEIPAAWLEQKAQAIRDETEARSKLMQLLTAKSAELGFADEALLDRGLNNLLGRAYREQENREAVAGRTTELLSDSPAPADSLGPTDDWMNVFEDHAARASSDELREVWARILAGEIRKPQSFSLATMHFLAVLDSVRAETIKQSLPYVVDGFFIPYKPKDSKMSVGQAVLLEDFGFGSRADGVSVPMQPQPHGKIVARMGKVGFVIDSGGTKVDIGAFILSSTGRELVPVIQEDVDPEALIEELKTHENVKEIRQGVVEEQVKGYGVRHSRVVFTREDKK